MAQGERKIQVWNKQPSLLPVVQVREQPTHTWSCPSRISLWGGRS